MAQVPKGPKVQKLKAQKNKDTEARKPRSTKDWGLEQSSQHQNGLACRSSIFSINFQFFFRNGVRQHQATSHCMPRKKSKTFITLNYRLQCYTILKFPTPSLDI